MKVTKLLCLLAIGALLIGCISFKTPTVEGTIDATPLIPLIAKPAPAPTTAPTSQPAN